MWKPILYVFLLVTHDYDLIDIFRYAYLVPKGELSPIVAVWLLDNLLVNFFVAAVPIGTLLFFATRKMLIKVKVA